MIVHNCLLVLRKSEIILLIDTNDLRHFSSRVNRAAMYSYFGCDYIKLMVTQPTTSEVVLPTRALNSLNSAE